MGWTGVPALGAAAPPGTRLRHWDAQLSCRREHLSHGHLCRTRPHGGPPRRSHCCAARWKELAWRASPGAGGMGQAFQWGR